MSGFAALRPLTVIAVAFVVFAAALSAGCSLSMPGAERPQWSLMETELGAEPGRSPGAAADHTDAGAL